MTVLTLQWTFVEFEQYEAAEHEHSEIHVAAVTEQASFHTRLYVTRAQVRALASALRAWRLSGEAPHARWGEERGAMDIRFGFEPPGRVAIALRLRQRPIHTGFGVMADQVELYLASEPILIDHFADQLADMAEWKSRSAELQAAHFL
ncbi:hypothetical protein GLE_0079 [Lysobacter enzymogenes]|uniref:Uncharacterized protein n=1 Tax=Lysobacter enzymogenes TaxID=69 RepID=A0A0S2DA66_LYSEN|nr:hypothetical protein [Lysobacter enzymogenes]ALN55438.1 hypothetical protein GLE_0079 [Lysobacter enzymogenes]QCW24515.1 hypothetical protein FE772_01310 [Lysobacter enzymogenes]UZW60522.1 hypothetical protein BV903_025270 [Lysobacter enzymogenes]